ncbi:unnamed protein product [Rotaria sp. Silwood1]|nr:unnamed protein product [Rotaria sp. Silwood1]CAF4609157.1 unnamed protein product [Rotaria sp. Silwood1]
MSQSCSIINCILTSRGLCDCCQQYLCLKHLIEHNASLITQLSPLTDEIIALEDRLKTLNIQKIIDNSCEKLEEWRQACHKKIDSYFEQKCEEINQFVNERVNQQQEELNRLQLKITKLINVQETTRLDIGLLTSTIHQLERNINNIDQTHFTINTCPLVIDNTLVHIKKTAEHELDLSTLSPVYRTIHRPEGSFRPFTVNDRYFLIHQHPNICLFDQEMNIVNQTLWSYGGILDIYWSSTLDRFIVIGEKNMFLINENTMSINSVHTIAEQNWKSCTCSDTILFASTTEWGSSIMEFTLFPVIELIREWKCPLTCGKGEIIHNIAYDNGNLALIVKDKFDTSSRIELRCVNTFDRIWTLQFDIMSVRKKVFRCSSLPCNEWLIVDCEIGRLLQVTKDGKIKKIIQYHPSPYYAILFDRNKLAVSTANDVNLHTIQSNE